MEIAAPTQSPARSAHSSSSNVVPPANNRDLMHILAGVLTKLVLRNDAMPSSRVVEPSPFNALSPPDISIEAYLERLLKYMCCSDECTILALIYIDRIIQFNNQTFVLTSLNIHRLLITSLVVAAKFFDDRYYTNTYYAQVGGITVAELNTMELEFLFLINFSLHVCDDHYRRYYSELKKHVPAHPAPPSVPIPPPVPQWNSSAPSMPRRSSSRRELEPANSVPQLPVNAAANALIYAPAPAAVAHPAFVPANVVAMPKQVYPAKYTVPLPMPTAPQQLAPGCYVHPVVPVMRTQHPPHLIQPQAHSGSQSPLVCTPPPATMTRRSPVSVVDPHCG